MTGSTVASAAPGPSSVPSPRTTPAIEPAPAPRVVEVPTPATEPAPPPTPPDAVPTTVEELPAGFWDDGPNAAPPPAPPQPATSPIGDADGSAPALASLQGLALLQAVFPGRVVKVERTATIDDDAVPDEPAVTGPVDDPDDDPHPGAEAPPPRTP